MDRAKLESAVKFLRDYKNWQTASFAHGFFNKADAEILIEAAEAHLATLPRKVKVTGWLLLRRGRYYDATGSEDTAALWKQNIRHGEVIVELAGEYETTEPA